MSLLFLPMILFGDGIPRVTLQTPVGSRQPQIAVRDWDPTSHSQVFVAYGTKTAVHVSISSDGGASFGEPKKIDDVGMLSLGLRRGPRIAIAGETIVIAAIASEEPGSRASDILGWHSTDRGANWIYDGRVNEIRGTAREGLHAMAAGPKGEIFCVWVDLEKDAPRICGASTSNEQRGRWSPARVVFGDPDGICPCCHPSVAFDAKGKLYVMWRGHDRDSRDMVVASSDDLGATFSKPAKLGTGTWKIEACPMDGGAIDVVGGRLRSIWRRESSIFRAELSGPEHRLGDGEQPWLAHGKDGDYAVWLEKRDGPLMLLLPRAKEPIRLDDRANDPVLASGSLLRSPVIAAWESGPSDAPRIVVARLQPGSK